MDILEIISYCRSDPFTLIDLELLVNSYMIACTNFQNFEEGENCASTISVEHTLGYDMNLFGSNMILIGSYLVLFGLGFKFQELSVMLVATLINFWCEKSSTASLLQTWCWGFDVSFPLWVLLYYILWINGYF